MRELTHHEWTVATDVLEGHDPKRVGEITQIFIINGPSLSKEIVLRDLAFTIPPGASVIQLIFTAQIDDGSLIWQLTGIIE